MKFCCLSSGSKQNAFYVETERTAILVDAGIPYRKLARFLNDIGRDVEDVEAVFVTHEHLDHVRALEKLAEKRAMPVFIHDESLRNMPFGTVIGNVRSISEGDVIEWKDLVVMPFAVCHDAAHTLGFKIVHNDRSLALATDMGSFSDDILDIFRGANLIAVESNYDHDMLRESFYALELKKRIAGKYGHLSNRGSYEFLVRTITETTDNVYFLHLSENNNHPSHIEKIVKEDLSSRYSHVTFRIAHREEPGDLFDV